MRTDETSFFWSLADPLLTEERITQGSIMGFPCLRIDGDFFATCEHRSGDLVVKLPAERVQELIDDGTGQAFSPAGRRFREWVRIPERDAKLWRKLMKEARSFVGK